MGKKANFIFCFMMALFLIFGCVIGTDDDGDGDDPETVDMSGLWKGTMTTQRFGVSELSLDLVQDNSNISGQMIFDGMRTSDVNGAVDHSTITLSGIYPTDIDEPMEFAFEGRVNANTYDGTLTVFLGTEIDEQGCDFSVSKGGGGGPIDPDSKVYEVDVNSCLKLSTGEVGNRPCQDMDMEILEGARVDLYSGEDIFCVQEGAFTDLGSVPSDYSGCRWSFAVEGAFGLENTGLIVRDLSFRHHYKMRIIENEPPTITFEYESID